MSKFVIKAKYRGGQSEVIDEAENLEEAKRLKWEYLRAFADEWFVWYENK